MNIFNQNKSTLTIRKLKVLLWDWEGNKKKENLGKGVLLEKWRRPTLPQRSAVPSARASLTSLFGMGRGGSSLL